MEKIYNLKGKNCKECNQRLSGKLSYQKEGIQVCKTCFDKHIIGGFVLKKIHK